jgi:hypothetical protein
VNAEIKINRLYFELSLHSICTASSRIKTASPARSTSSTASTASKQSLEFNQHFAYHSGISSFNGHSSPKYLKFPSYNLQSIVPYLESQSSYKSPQNNMLLPSHFPKPLFFHQSILLRQAVRQEA